MASIIQHAQAPLPDKEWRGPFTDAAKAALATLPTGGTSNNLLDAMGFDRYDAKEYRTMAYNKIMLLKSPGGPLADYVGRDPTRKVKHKDAGGRQKPALLWRLPRRETPTSDEIACLEARLAELKGIASAPVVDREVCFDIPAPPEGGYLTAEERVEFFRIVTEEENRA